MSYLSWGMPYEHVGQKPHKEAIQAPALPPNNGGSHEQWLRHAVPGVLTDANLNWATVWVFDSTTSSKSLLKYLDLLSYRSSKLPSAMPSV